MGKFIAVANMKGGVGKTTTVVSLAEFLAKDGATSVLIIDLDPQASASICMVGDATLANLIQVGRTLDAYLAVKFFQKKEASLEKRIRRGCCAVTLNGNPILLNLIPTSPELRLVEREMYRGFVRRKLDPEQIDQAIAEIISRNFLPLKNAFDFIIFDCAPGISSLTEAAIRSSDLIIVPTIPDRISAFGLVSFCELIKSGPNVGHNIPLLRVLLTRVQQTRQHKETIQAIVNLDVTILNTFIPQSAKLSEGLMIDDGITLSVPTLSRKYGPDMIETLTRLAAEIRSIVA